MQLPENIKTIIERLESAGYEAYAVGGCVRDNLAGLTPPDYDITTNALPVEIKKAFHGYKTIDIGEKHGTIAVIADGDKIEITTFRTDGDYSDSRRPDSVEFTRDLKTDLSRRDFTINAMAYSEKTGLIDPLGGKQDLDDSVLRCVGDPHKRFEEDALRIMRALRFMSERGFMCESNTEKALRDLKDNLLRIAPERISAEFSRLLMGDYADIIITEYYDVLGVIFPELLACAGFNQYNKYHCYDVLEHTAKSIVNAPADLTIRLALFFHDIAKPECFVFDKGAGHFDGHSERSAAVAEKTMRRLCYNKSLIYSVVMLIENHTVKLSHDTISVRGLLNKFGYKMLMDLCALKIADDEAKAEHVKMEMHKHYMVIQEAERIVERGDCFTLGTLAVDGNDLIEIGFRNKQIGTKLRILLDKVITGQLENEKEPLLNSFTKGKKANQDNQDIQDNQDNQENQDKTD
jgi:tRNA nucleotidyltransferase (CCA-adding enzyme)